MKTNIPIFGVAVALLSALLLLGCGGSSLSGSSDLPDPLIRFLNASMDSVSVDYFLNEDLKAANLGYTNSSLDFEKVPFIEEVDGAYDISVVQTGEIVPVDSINLLLERDLAYLVCLVGLIDPLADVEKRAREVVVQVDRTKPVGNKARLLVLHGFCRSAGNMTPSINFQTPGDNPLFRVSGISFGNFASLTVDSGKFTFEARRGDASGTTIYASKLITLDSGGLYLALVSGIEDSINPAFGPRIDFIQLSTKTP